MTLSVFSRIPEKRFLSGTSKNVLNLVLQKKLQGAQWRLSARLPVATPRVTISDNNTRLKQFYPVATEIASLRATA